MTKPWIRRLPSLNALRAFEAAARLGSFRAAAEELCVTQGAVAQQVRGLESELGAPLFERLPRGLQPTSAAREYAAAVSAAFASIEAATRALRAPASRLTISVTPSFAARWLVPRLPSFVEAHPLIDLRILASEHLADFHGDDVDVAVRQGHPPFGPGLEATLLFAQDVVAVCSPALLGHRARRLRAAELKRHVLLHDGHDLWPRFAREALGMAPPDAAGELRFNQTALALDAAIAGQGIALASRFLVTADVAAGRLALAFAQSLAAGRDFHVITPRKPRRPKEVALLRGWLLQIRDAQVPETR